MRLLVASVLMYGYKISEIIPLVKSYGYDGLEIWHFHLLQTGENPEDIARLAEQHHVNLTVHALSWDLNFTSKLEMIREASLLALESSIHLCRDLRAETVVVHPGRVTIPQDSPENNWPTLIEGTKRLADCAAGDGVELSMEIMEHIPREFFINPADAVRLVQAVDSPALSITVDSAHIPWDMDMVEYLQSATRVNHIHISDSTSKKLHLPLGRGERDHTGFLRAILANYPDINIVIEGMEFNRHPDLAIYNKQQIDILISQLND